MKPKKKPVVGVAVAIGKPKKDRYTEMLSKAMGKNAGPTKRKGGY